MKNKKSNIFKKLKSRKGETLVEVMVAMLVGVFSCLMLAQVISVSTDIDSDSRTLFVDYYSVNDNLAKAFAGESYDTKLITEKKGNIIITGNGDSNVSRIVYSAEYYVNDQINGEKIIAYKAAD